LLGAATEAELERHGIAMQLIIAEEGGAWHAGAT
jgi:hypothetical protein